MVWIYVIDLDLDVFRVCYRARDAPPAPGHRDTQYFRLDNIPRELFQYQMVSLGYSIMGVDVPPEYCANHLSDAPPPNTTLLALYASFSPPPAATFSVPVRPRRFSWHNVQLLLVKHFVDTFAYSCRDACPSPTSSPFVFQQIAYAILSITSTVGLKFYRRTSLGTVDPVLRTPCWEPSNTDIYYLGDVLIVLDWHLRAGEPSGNTHASIARAVQVATELPRVAVVFSMHAVVVVNIAIGGIITHTPVLPLFTLDDAHEPFDSLAMAALTEIGYATPGILALLDLFTVYPRVTSGIGAVPPALPTEVWRMVFRRADEKTQAVLEECCRFFRVLAGENPRIGGGTVVSWREQGFLWVGAKDDTECVVNMMEMEKGEEGWDVVVWGEEMFRLGMPTMGLV